MTRYDYNGLKDKALSNNATLEDLKNLADWFDEFDPSSWNGEFYNMEDGMELVPEYAKDKDGEYYITGYYIR